MDDNLKQKANPTIVLLLDYLSVGVILGIYLYLVITKMVPPNGFEQLLVAVLASLGLYRATSNTSKPSEPVKIINTVPTPQLPPQQVPPKGDKTDVNKA